MKISNSILFIVFFAVVVASCKPSVPSQYIQPDELEAILYDYHLAGGMALGVNSSERNYNDRLYRLAVLKKYGVTEEEFDSSMVYYMRHTERLHEIAKRVEDRMNNEARAVGADVYDEGDSELVVGDTASIWRGESNMVLIPSEPYNYHSFVITPDTSFHQGDRIILKFNAQFLYQDGMRDGVAMLAVRFKNDSVGTRMMHMSSANRYTLEVTDAQQRGIREIRGFFFLSRDANATATTLKVMIINNIQMLRFHEKKKETPTLPSDSIKVTQPADSARRLPPPPPDSHPDEASQPEEIPKPPSSRH